MKKVRIHRPEAGLIDEEDLLKLLREAGLEVEAESEDAGCEPEEEAEALIVVLATDLADDPDLERVLQDAEHDGCKIVGLWPRGMGGDGVSPPGFELGDDMVSWNPGSLKRAIGVSVPVCEAPDGRPARKPDRPHLKCG